MPRSVAYRVNSAATLHAKCSDFDAISRHGENRRVVTNLCPSSRSENRSSQSSVRLSPRIRSSDLTRLMLAAVASCVPVGRTGVVAAGGSVRTTKVGAGRSCRARAVHRACSRRPVQRGACNKPWVGIPSCHSPPSVNTKKLTNKYHSVDHLNTSAMR